MVAKQYKYELLFIRSNSGQKTRIIMQTAGVKIKNGRLDDPTNWHTWRYKAKLLQRNTPDTLEDKSIKPKDPGGTAKPYDITESDGQALLIILTNILLQ
jgi:hypothetical protein